MKIRRDKTRRTRNELSTPVATAIGKGIISLETSIHDYGCGLGSDVELLNAAGFDATGHDLDKGSKRQADIVTCSYVINTIEDAVERALLVKDAFDLAVKGLVISARTDRSAAKTWTPMLDGFLNGNNSFHKFFTNTELVAYVSGITGKAAKRIADGIVYVSKEA